VIDSLPELSPTVAAPDRRSPARPYTVSVLGAATAVGVMDRRPSLVGATAARLTATATASDGTPPTPATLTVRGVRFANRPERPRPVVVLTRRDGPTAVNPAPPPGRR
jgi:hypothetical protein